jgi:hypothetical protein
MAIAVIALSMWMLLDPDFQEWVYMLEVPQFYAGIYVLLICGIVVMLVCILGCLGALMEQTGKLKIVSSTKGERDPGEHRERVCVCLQIVPFDLTLGVFALQRTGWKTFHRISSCDLSGARVFTTS